VDLGMTDEQRSATPVGPGNGSVVWPDHAPELATARLRLRPLDPQTDAAGLLRLLGDPEVTRYHNAPTLTTIADAHAALDRLQQRHAARESIRWAIELAGGSGLIGTLGLVRVDHEQRRGELGYELVRRWWGRGLMPEAAAAVIRYGFATLGLHRIEAGVLPGNDASVRVLVKLGFVEEGLLRDYLFLKGRFWNLRRFGLLETDPRPAPNVGGQRASRK
jgi:ribosomal-protein-alanine N-acetyltransferase